MLDLAILHLIEVLKHYQVVKLQQYLIYLMINGKYYQMQMMMEQMLEHQRQLNRN